MPRVINFNNRQTVEPGVYSQIKSRANVPTTVGTYGNVFLIDTGIGNTYGWGAGITGTTASNGQSIYEFQSLADAKKAIGGGILYDLLDYLFIPTTKGLGAKKLFYTRAATTVAATKTITFSTGAITVKCKNEGLRGNGSATSGYLTKGYSMKLSTGVLDSTKFILKFYEGQYRGKDSNGVEYEVSEASIVQSAKDTLIFQSAEFSTVNDLVLWMNGSYLFNLYFKLSASTASAVALTSGDVTSFSSHQLFAGGTEDYSTTNMDTVLASIEDVDNSMFLCTDYGTANNITAGVSSGINKGANCTSNLKILSHIVNNSTYTEKVMYVGFGDNLNDFALATTGSLAQAAYWNSQYVVGVHSAIKVPGSTANTANLGYRELPALYHAAMWCGRAAGVEPQISLTYKDIRIIGLSHELKKSERVQALLGGVGHTRFVPNMGWVINQGINTMQQNASLVYPDGSSPSIQIMRIIHQINKELVINATPRFTGSNINTTSAEDIKLFTESFLRDRTASKLEDDLIIRFENVQATLTQDIWNVTYCFVPNSEINRTYFTGYVIDPNISI